MLSIDHFVLTVADIDATCAFYERALGMRAERFETADGALRTALIFGRQKINLHPAGREYEPKAARPTPGSGDFCLLTEEPVAEAAARLVGLGIPVEEGPVPRTGATGRLLSIYLRDPDDNLVEIANLEPEGD